MQLSAMFRGLNVFSKRNIVATVNLDCRLDLKTIALHARNAEYNPKVNSFSWLFDIAVAKRFHVAFRGCHYADSRTENYGTYFRVGQNGCDWCEI